MIQIRKLTSKGDETVELPMEEAENMLDVEVGRYFIVDDATGRVMNEIHLEEGQKLTLIPKVSGG